MGSDKLLSVNLEWDFSTLADWVKKIEPLNSLTRSP